MMKLYLPFENLPSINRRKISFEKELQIVTPLDKEYPPYIWGTVTVPHGCEELVESYLDKEVTFKRIKGKWFALDPMGNRAFPIEKAPTFEVFNHSNWQE